MMTLEEQLRNTPHRRWNALKGEWVLVSPHRTQRPWQGQTEDTTPQHLPEYDPTCYLCPGNKRAGGAMTPNYVGTYIFTNDYAALLPDAPHTEVRLGSAGLLRAESERGICRVLCFDPRHDLTLATMPTASVERVIDVWSEQLTELGAREETRYVQIFENRGAMMGASNPHPHGQIWATEHIPNETLAELHAQREHYAGHGRTLLADYLADELELGTRIVYANDDFVVLVPFWAVWPFETLVLPRRSVATLIELTPAERTHLADVLSTLTRAYDRIFDTPFPYSMGLHPSPTDGEPHPEWTFHIHFYPPLLRSATVRKFMVGFELLGSPQRDITPESAAESLRNIIQRQ